MNQKNKFKQTEIGMIPEDWELTTLENASQLLTDGSHFSPKEEHNGTHFIATVKDMEDYAINIENCKHISEEVFNELSKSNCRPEKGDVLFSKDGTMGVCFVFKQDEPIVILSSIALIRPNNKFDPFFLKYYLSDKKTQDFIIAGFSSGSALPRLTLVNLKQIPVVKPDITEQRIIANVLSDPDSKIELNQQMNKTLEAIAKAIFKHWFIDFEFPNEEGEPYKSSGGEMVYNEELRKKIPKGWELKSIGDVVSVKGGSTPSTKNVEYWNNGKINWCTPKDLSKLNSSVLLDTERKITESGLLSISSDLLPIGTVLLSSRAPIGYLAISEIPVAVNQGFIAIVCDKIISKYFMLFWLQHNMGEIESRSHGTTFEEINKTSFRSIRILVPPTKVVDDYDKLMHALYSKIVKNEKESKTLTHLRDSLLPKLMSGKIRVPVEVR